MESKEKEFFTYGILLGACEKLKNIHERLRCSPPPGNVVSVNINYAKLKSICYELCQLHCTLNDLIDHEAVLKLYEETKYE